MQARSYFHSPFSDKDTYEPREKALLLIFALSELLACADEPTYNWTIPLPSLQERAYDAPLNKLQEHILLLRIAFPEHQESFCALKEKVSHLTYFVEKKISFSHKDLLEELFFFLEPLIKECKEDKQLLFFLLKSQEKLNFFLKPSYLLLLLKELYPEGLSNLQTHLCDHFHKKGFTRLIPEVTLLLQRLEKL